MATDEKGFLILGNDPIFLALVNERDDLRARLEKAEAESRGNWKVAEGRHAEIKRLLDRAEQAERQVEDLRCEALAWRKQAETRESNVTITLSMDTLRQVWEMVRPAGCNPYVSPED